MENNKTQDKNLSQNQTQPNQTNQNSDSNTKVYLRLGEPKKTVSFKCNLELWNAFKSEIKRKNLSICHVLEPMIFGWLYGEVYLSNTIKPLKIENLIVERAVRRVRRYAVEVEGGSVGVTKRYCALKDTWLDSAVFECGRCENLRCWGKGVSVE